MKEVLKELKAIKKINEFSRKLKMVELKLLKEILAEIKLSNKEAKNGIDRR